MFLNFKVNNKRTKNILKHVSLSFFYKGGTIMCNFLLIPISLNYLDDNNYGIWLTLSSFIAWFSFFDIGLGHGLRNKFTEAKTKGNLDLVKYYVSTAYISLGLVALIVFLLFLLFNSFINWTVFFNSNSSLNHLNILVPIVFGFFCIQLVVKLITTIFMADQNHSMQGKVSFISTLSSLIIIYFLTKFTKGSLLYFGIIYSSLPIIILIILNFFAFTTTYKEYKPKMKFFKMKYLKDLFGLGISFFIIQIAGLIIFSSDNMIVSQLFSPSSVVPYNIAYKYFSISNMVLLIILTPYWSAITEAFNKDDYVWIKNSMKKLIIISFGSVIILLVMLLISNYAYSLWIGNQVKIPLTLSVCMAIYFSCFNLYLPFTYFINGTGKIRLQMFTLICMAIINIPLSYYFGKSLNMGLPGVILATIFCVIPHAVLSPIQYFKIINKRAYGIWNK